MNCRYLAPHPLPPFAGVGRFSAACSLKSNPPACREPRSRARLAVERPRVDRAHRHVFEAASAGAAEEAAALARVAGDAGLVDQQQQRIAVAIDAEIDEPL